MRRRLFFWALLAAAVAPYFVNLGANSIWDANEAYYVETPREMIERGDFVNPSFNYEPRFNKPVLSYWLVAGLYQAFGVSVEVQRLAIALCGLVVVAGAFVLARAASPHALAPLLAAIGLAAGPRLFMFSRRILIDVAMTAMMTLTLAFFALSEQYPARRRLFLLLMYVSVGLGVLTKGPVAAVFPLLVFTSYLAVHRELHRLREMMIPAGALVALAIAAPWYVALYLQHGWTHITAFFIGENLGRFTETIGVQARGPFFYVPVVFTDALPWSLVLPAAVFAWFRERRGADRFHRMRTLLLLWVVVIVLVFSFSQTKQDLYIFPIAAAVAALGADFVARSIDGRPAPAHSDGVLARTLLVLGGVLAGGGLFVLYVFGAAQTAYQLDGARLIAWIAISGGVAIALQAWRRRLAGAVAVTLVVFVACNWVLALRVLPGFERYKPVIPLSREIQRRATPGDVVAHFDVAFPSMVFYLRRHIEIEFDRDAFARLLRSDRRVFAVVPADRYEEILPSLGVRTCVVARHATWDIRLRSVLEMRPPPEVLLVTNQCDAGARAEQG